MMSRRRTKATPLVCALFAAVVGSAITACSASPTEPGACKIRDKCSKAKLGGYGSDVRIRAVPTEVDIGCGFDGDFPGPIQLTFRVEKKLRGALSGAGDDGGEGEEWVPIPNISFEPMLFGGLSGSDEANPDENRVDGNIEFKYQGIATPKSAWCTDSCGMATIEAWPVCSLTGDTGFTLGIRSGSLSSGDDGGFVRVNISGEEG